MSLSQEIVDSIIARNNINANEKIYDTLFGLASEKIGMRKVELAQNMFATGNYEDEDEDEDEYYEYDDDDEDDEDEEDVPEEEYEQ
jgi:hypothetical protein